MSLETTLILFKTDCVEKKIVGEILKRFESEGFKIKGMKMISLSTETLNEHSLINEAGTMATATQLKAPASSQPEHARIRSAALHGNGRKSSTAFYDVLTHLTRKRKSSHRHA